MIQLPRMLMIGAAGRNSGKTELACSLIRRFSNSRPIVGVKVTTVQEKDGNCPRGGEGCGVCSSLEGEFCITDEINAPDEKDTARLLAAGAERVFWLRVVKESLLEGCTALLDKIGDDAVIICESNSLRQIIEPGLFFIVRTSEALFKPSAEDVRQFADRIISSDGKNYDIDIETISLGDNGWGLREDATAVIMAGGQSVRAGRDKAMIEVDGIPMIHRIYKKLFPNFEEVIISASDKDKYNFLGARIAVDDIFGQGPLMGIAGALREANTARNFVIACDVSDINMSLVRHLIQRSENSEIVVVRSKNGLEPLFAVYNKSVLGRIEKLLEAGERKIRMLFDLCETDYYESDTDILNLNTEEAFLEYQESITRNGSFK